MSSPAVGTIEYVGMLYFQMTLGAEYDHLNRTYKLDNGVVFATDKDLAACTSTDDIHEVTEELISRLDEAYPYSAQVLRDNVKRVGEKPW